MSHELETAFKIKQHLNQSLRALPADKTERLRAAREQALARQRKGVGLKLAAAGGLQLEWLGHLVPLAVLAAGLIGISYWHQSNRAEENADIDLQMLVDELPPQAYADKGFGVWIKRGAQ
jgi:phage protein D